MNKIYLNKKGKEMIELLEKGQNVSLKDKIDSGLKKIDFGLAWDESQGGLTFDADASAIMIDKDGKVIKDSILYFGTTKVDGVLITSCGSMKHSGDNLTGDADGDDETITIDLNLIPENVERIVLITNIYNALEKKQNFGQNTQYEVSIYNAETKEKLFTADLKEDHSTATAMIVGELYKHDGSWKFRALIKGTKDGSLSEVINNNF
jgi:tellurium resistance protein TerD